MLPKINFQHISLWLLLACSTFFFLPSFRWLYSAFVELYDSINLILLLLVASAIFIKYWKTENPNKLEFQFKTLPYFIALFSIVGFIYIRTVWNIHILSTLFFFSYLFGILGLFVSTKVWTRALFPFLLICMTLPFGNLMDVYIGFPLRLMAVDFIHHSFNSLGIENLSRDSIITIENNATQVDFSCSGLKGMWAALLFYFTLTWIDSIKIGFAWTSGLFLLLISIISANIIRISLIVLISMVFNNPELADAIHSALGVIGFIFSCAFVYLFSKSRLFERFNSKGLILPSFKRSNKKTKPLFGVISMYCLSTLLLLGSVFTKPPTLQHQPTELEFSWPEEWNVQDLELTTLESQFLKQQGGSAVKITVEYDSLFGSILVVKSAGWRSHHNPENCLRAGGHKINKMETVMLEKEHPIKWMQVNQNASAAYWFQSPSFSTDDFSTRVWSEIKREEDEWLMASVVFNDHSGFQKQEIQKILTKLYNTLNTFYPQTKTL